MLAGGAPRGGAAYRRFGHRDRLNATGTWRFVWQDGRELGFTGVALDREYDAEIDGYGIIDGSAGIRGRLRAIEDYQELKMLASQLENDEAALAVGNNRQICAPPGFVCPGNGGLKSSTAHRKRETRRGRIPKRGYPPTDNSGFLDDCSRELENVLSLV